MLVHNFPVVHTCVRCICGSPRHTLWLCFFGLCIAEFSALGHPACHPLLRFPFRELIARSALSHKGTGGICLHIVSWYLVLPTLRVTPEKCWLLDHGIQPPLFSVVCTTACNEQDFSQSNAKFFATDGWRTPRSSWLSISSTNSLCKEHVQRHGIEQGFVSSLSLFVLEWVSDHLERLLLHDTGSLIRPTFQLFFMNGSKRRQFRPRQSAPCRDDPVFQFSLPTTRSRNAHMSQQNPRSSLNQNPIPGSVPSESLFGVNGTSLSAASLSLIVSEVKCALRKIKTATRTHKQF